MGASTLSFPQAQASKSGKTTGPVSLQIAEIGMSLVYPQVSPYPFPGTGRDIPDSENRGAEHVM